MSTPAVTVLMTVYNARAYLDVGIRSILGQTFRDLEFLIIDDGSTDGGEEILKAWAGKDSRIRLILNPVNQGQTVCLNQGITEARAPWIARQDADDLPHPQRLELQMAELHRRPELVILGTNGWLITEDGTFCGLINAPCGEESVRWFTLYDNPFIHASVCFRRDAALAVGKYDPHFRITQDYDLWLKLLKTGPGDNLPQRLISYRVVDSSLSHQKAEATASEAMEANRRAFVQWGLESHATRSNLALVSQLRDGFVPGKRAEFWALHRELEKTRPAPACDRAEARCLLHWKAAGKLGASAAMAQEMSASLRAQPDLFFSLLRDRMMGPR
ncbi:glycosyltransferase family 2 protein [Terrimicrobium sacchariphilum]|nr:glycosyltransferase [Terrimicrobium sacchariphilum]